MRTEQTRNRRGIRVGLVMNGGVSLAVWMGGIARELHAAAMAPDSSPARATDEPAEGDSPQRLWAILMARAGVVIDIDVIAGTSAGGLNGTILASCLAQGAAFPNLREVWADTAQVSRGRLLRTLDNEEDANRSRPSLLDGAYFEDRIREQFASIEQSARSEWRREVECLVTATALSSTSLTMRDDYDRPQSYVDSRRLYRFSYAPASFTYDPSTGTYGAADTGNGFTDSDTTARAARASCSFPVAFSPVPESSALARRRWTAGRSSDGVLMSAIDDLAPLPRTWLMDGGVLDNAPFEPVLEAIQRRPIDGPWRRVLAYVVPSGAVSDVAAPPPVTEEQADASLPNQPEVARVLGSVLNAWRESDSRLDAEALTRHRAAASRADFTAERLIHEARTLQETAPPWLEAVGPLFHTYRERRLRAIEGSANADAAWLVPATFSVDGTHWNWGDAVALKILRWWGRELNWLGAAQPPLAELGEVQSRAVAVAQAIARLRDDISILTADPSLNSPDSQPSSPEPLDEDPRVFASLGELRDLMYEGARIYAATLRGDLVEPDATPDVIAADTLEHLRRALAVEVVTYAGSSAVDLIDTPPFTYLRMGPDIDSPASPDELLPRLGWWGSAKLYGTALNHFAGFIDERWRRHDWTWGRLDAVAHIVGLVVAESSSELMPEDQKSALILEWQERLQEAVLHAEQRPPLADWVAAESIFANLGGATNSTVMNSLHASPQGHAVMSQTIDEGLGLLATLGGERSPKGRWFGAVVRYALYLEKPRPSSPLSRLKAFGSRIVAGRLRAWIKTWIEGTGNGAGTSDG